MSATKPEELPWTLVIVVAATIVGLVLRLWGLGDESLSHTEVYVPGLTLVPDISEPPPRLSFLYTLWWHFHDEPHPMGWYLAMFGWTSLAGTSEFALRLPPALLGAAAIPMLYAAGRRVHGTQIAAFAAVLLALHGFHLFWSQNARMYSAGAFLGLLATWFLLRLSNEREPARGLALGYVLTCLAGINTVEFFWPFFFLHMGWVMLTMPAPASIVPAALVRCLWAGPRLLQIQSIALILGAPDLLHSAYRARHGAGGEPSISFLLEYFSFGFLFAHDLFSFPNLELPGVLVWLLAIAALVVLLASLCAPATREHVAAAPSLPGWIAPVLALVTVALMLWLASIAHRRNSALMVMALLPVLALLVPSIGVLARGLVARIPALDQRVGRLSPQVLLMWMLAVVGPLILMAASFVIEIAAPRAFLIFVPYLILLGAAGATALLQETALHPAPAIALAAVFALSVPYAANKPISPNDYKTLAEDMRPMMKPGDLIFLRHKHWADTPFLYYMDDASFVTENFAQALEHSPEARIWLVTWPNEVETVITDERRDALIGYAPVETLEAFRASAELFVRDKTQ